MGALMGGHSPDILRYIPLYKAVLKDDLNAAEQILDQDPEADVAKITYFGQTALQIGAGSNCSHRVVDMLVNRIAAKDIMMLRTTDIKSNNALHTAAIAGNTNAVKALLEKDPGMALIQGIAGCTALKLAAMYERKETFRYLLGVTPNEVGEDGTSEFSGQAGGDLIRFTIIAGFYDIALGLVRKYPNLATDKSQDDSTALEILASQPWAFPSGRSCWFWENLIYSWTPLNKKTMVIADSDSSLESENVKITWFKSSLTAWFRYVPLLKRIQETKLQHEQTDQLMKAMISTVLNVGDHSVVWEALGTAILIATGNGTYELIEECIKLYPGIMWYGTDDGWNLFSFAIKYRQDKVYNLVHQMTEHVVGFATNIVGKDKDTALHLAGRKAHPLRLKTITGAALQLQRELLWFKEVEKFMKASNKESLNKEEKTPQMVFTDEHKDLVEQGEKWMKDTASSSSLVAALIVTVAFAAIFTVPGGNKDNGTPNYIHDSTFVLFAISDSIALFSSVTSVLMFLATLTSRYAESDFLYALPKRITIGLLTLFISIAAIMVTFCAALALVLKDKLAWISIPVGLIACVPVTFFAMLQFPLLVELVLSTYGPSIFRKQSDLILH